MIGLCTQKKLFKPARPGRGACVTEDRESVLGIVNLPIAIVLQPHLSLRLHHTSQGQYHKYVPGNVVYGIQVH